MIFIAHRGNTNGPSVFENSPAHIDAAISGGHNAEVDIWKLDDDMYLGHDEPTYKIIASFLEERRHVLWCHAKNVDALKWLVDNDFNTFFHDTDDYVLTSLGYIWCYPGKPLVKGSICVMPEMAKDPEYLEKNKHLAYAVCSDYLPKCLR